MRERALTAALVLSALATRPAFATCARQNDVAVHPLAFASRGLGLEYERYAFPPRISLAGGLSLRAAALGDFSSLTAGTMVEGRWWLLGQAPLGCVGERAMIGPYAGLRFEASETTVGVRATGRTVGTAWRLDDVVLLGYRQPFWQVVELSAWVGAALVHDIDGSGRLAPTTGATLLFGLSYGWFF